MIQLIQDTRESNPLIFTKCEDLEVVQEALPVGDYCARFKGILDRTVVERKSIADLFNSFSSGYENERAKIDRAKSLGLKLILAIEGTAFDVREGYGYWKQGEFVKSKKDGLSQVKQLMTMTRKGYFDIWWCKSRAEMAFLIQEYYLSILR